MRKVLPNFRLQTAIKSTPGAPLLINLEKERLWAVIALRKREIEDRVSRRQQELALKTKKGVGVRKESRRGDGER